MPKSALDKFSDDDVRALVRHPDPQQRAIAAQRICRAVRSGTLSDEEKVFARQLIAHMAEDAVALVRRALAVTLRNSPELPRAIAVKLAADLDNIAIPVLANSPVFLDEDLVEVLRSKASAKILAVARRPIVSSHLVEAIIRYGDSAAVAEVAANDGALIDMKTASRILDLYRDDDLIKDAFISRRDLPPRVLEKLVTMVSEEVAIVLHKRHNLPVALASDIATRTRERVTLDILSEDLHERDTALMISRLHEEGRLTRSLMVRAAGLGKMEVLKYGLAIRAGINSRKASLMIHDGGPVGIKALCQRAGLEPEDARFIRASVVIFRDLEISGIEYDGPYFQTLMIERLLTLPFDMAREHSEWFLERLDGLAKVAA